VANRTIRIEIDAEIGGLQARLRAAGQSVRSFTANAVDNMHRHSAAINDLSKSAGLMGAGLVASAAIAVKAFADWDDKMAQVKSLTHAGVSDMNQLREATMGFAKDFGVSASQAADAEIELVKAGVSVKDMMGGALKGALTLASAGQLDVADATSIAASAMTQFGLAGTDVTHIADLLAAGADKALGSVGDLGQGLKYVGPVAAGLNISIEQTVGVLSELAQNGILADQAGTSLRGMIQSLTSPSSIAAKTMAKYGIEVYNTQGAFVGLDGVAEQLKTKLGTLDQATRQQALGQIFGNEQITTATVLMKGGAAEVDKWTNSVNDQGFAAEQAGGKMNSLKGDLQRLKATLDNELVSTGSNAGGPLRGLVQSVTAVITKLDEVPDSAKNAAVSLAGSGGLALVGVAGLGKLGTALGQARASVQALGVSAKAAGLAVGAIGGLLTVGALGFEAWAKNAAQAQQRTEDFKSTLDDMGHTTDDTVRQINDTLSTLNFHRSFGEFITGSDSIGVIETAKRIGLSTEDLTNYILGQADAVDRVKKAVEAYDGISPTDKLFDPKIQEKADKLTGKLDDQAKSLTKAQKEAALAAEANQELGVSADDASAGTDAAATATADYTSKIQQAQQAQEQASDELLKWAQGVGQSGNAVLDLSKNVDTAKLSFQGWIKQLQDQALAAAQWDANLRRIAEKGGSQALLDSLSKLNPEEAGARVKQLAEGSTKDIDKLNAAYDSAQQHAQGLQDYLTQKFGPKPAPIILSVDTTHAQAALASIVQAADHTTAKLTIDGDDGPVRQTLKGAKASINDAAGTITIKANDGRAVETLHSYKTTVDQTTGHVIVSGTDASGRQVVAEFTSWADKQGAAIRVTADTSAFNNAMRQLYVPTVSVGVLAPGKADGGPISGGTPGKDSVPALLMPGEHVLTTSDVDKMGGQSAVYRMRSMAQAGLLRFAKGGAVPKTWHGKSLEYWQGKYATGTDYLQLKQAISNDKASLREKEKYKDKDGHEHQRYVLRGIDRRVANSQLHDDQKALSDANTARAFVKKYGSFASAIKARDAAKVTGRESKAESKAQSAVDRANARVDRLQELSDSAKSTITGSFDLASSYQGDTTDAYGYTVKGKGFTKAGILAAAKSQATTAKDFASGLSKLQGKLGTSGAAQAIIEQALSIFGSDPAQGLEFVKALNSMSTKELSSLKSSYNTIAAAGKSSGQSLTAADTTGGLSAAEKSADDLSDALDTLTTKVGKAGDNLTDALLKPFGLKLDKKGNIVKRAAGGWVDGPGTSTSDSVHLAASKGEFVVNAVAAKANAGLLEWINSRGATTVLPTYNAPTVATTTSAHLEAMVAAAVESGLAQASISIRSTVGLSERDQAQIVVTGGNRLRRDGRTA